MSPATPGFTDLLADEANQHPLEEVDSPVNIPLVAQLDLNSLGSLQVIVSHNPMTGEVQYQYQSRVISWMSLQLAPSKPLDQPDSLSQIKDTLSKCNTSQLKYEQIKCS